MGIFVGGKLIALGNLNELSQQISHSLPYQIEAEINWPDGELSMGRPQEIFKNIPQINAVKRENDTMYFFDCETDVSSDIAREVVSAGGKLTSLTKKESGLDEIYYRYFEGGLSHE